jgi:hypothetical protein
VGGNCCPYLENPVFQIRTKSFINLLPKPLGMTNFSLLLHPTMLSNNAPASIPLPTTPEEGPIDMPICSTPLAHKRSRTAVYATSNELFRDDTLIALGSEMVGYVVGPMPIEEFLEFLPQPRKTMKKFNEKAFTKIADQRSQAGLYDPFVLIPFSSLYSIAFIIF